MIHLPLFSVVIPTYNHAHLIGKCLDSLISQTFTDWEAIVVNNFSSDSTIEVVESYADPRIHLINNSNDGIIAVSRNRGIAEARGEWICFLDSDDWWTPNKLEACLPYLNDYDFLYHDMQIFEQNRGLQHNKFIRCRTPLHPYFENLLQWGNCCPNSSVVLRRSIIEKVGLLSEDKSLVAIEDFDYWLRVSKVTERFYHINQVLGYYWIGETSISANERQVLRHISLYNKHIKSIENVQLKSEILALQAYRNARAYAAYRNNSLARKEYKIAVKTTHFYTKCKATVFLLLNTFQNQ
ncbi:MAG: glycosyltransferase [Mucinivorans sp.]